MGRGKVGVLAPSSGVEARGVAGRGWVEEAKKSAGVESAGIVLRGVGVHWVVGVDAIVVRFRG